MTRRLLVLWLIVVEKVLDRFLGTDKVGPPQ